MNNVVGLITARGGSKGIPGKNIRPMAGRPMIAWTIEAARCARGVDRLIVSTEDQAIAEVACEWGAEVPFLRPAELATDTSSHLSVVEHALRWLNDQDGCMPRYILLLQPTSPLRTATDIEASIAMATSRRACAVVSVCKPTHHPLGLKRITPEGTMVDFDASDANYARRQDLPPVYAINGAIYLIEANRLLQARSFVPADTVPYIMPPERSLDVDELWQFEVAEMMLGRLRAGKSVQKDSS